MSGTSSPHNAGQTVTVEQISKMPVSDVNWGDITVTENWGRLFIKSDKETVIVHRPFYPAFIKAIQHFVEPAPATVSRADIEALADKIWRVHPKDLDAAGYIHKRHGGKYDNPRAAWYADQIEALLKKVQP